MKLELQFWFCEEPKCNFRQPLPSTAKFCPNCGTPRKNLMNQSHFNGEKNAGSKNQENDLVFPVHDIVLGKTTIKELYEQDKYFEIDDYRPDEGRYMKITRSISVNAAFDDSPIDAIYSEDYHDDIEIWNQIFPLQNGISINKIIKYCKKQNVDYISDDDGVVIRIKDGRFVLYFDDSDGIYLMKTYPCPNCGGLKLKLKGFDNTYLELICDSCHQSYDLIESRKIIRNSCPSCGSTDYEDDESEYLQFKCNECGKVWGCELESEDDSDHEDDDDDEVDDENDDELHKFFPVHGITLGETTVDDLEYDIPEDLDIEYRDDGDVIVWTITPNGNHGALIHSMPYEDELSMLYVTRYENMFIEWEELGFDWELSYNDWLKLFRSRGYAVDIVKYPKQEYYEKRGYWYLDARFRASAPDNTLFFELEFSFGEYGTKQTSKGTLYLIKATTDISHFDE